MKICNHFVVGFVFFLSHFYERLLTESMLFCPQGCCFSLSDLSAESEKKNQLCVLGASSVAGGESISKD
jgi:hypothetical protein